jgi:hypothetical protein
MQYVTAGGPRVPLRVEARKRRTLAHVPAILSVGCDPIQRLVNIAHGFFATTDGVLRPGIGDFVPGCDEMLGYLCGGWSRWLDEREW